MIIRSLVATFAVLVAIYAATTVKDPMARRVKALNERREQLKAGIVASTNKRKKLTNKNVAADRVELELLGGSDHPEHGDLEARCWRGDDVVRERWLSACDRRRGRLLRVASRRHVTTCT